MADISAKEYAAQVTTQLHPHIKFLQDRWQEFCAMVEKNAEQLAHYQEEQLGEIERLREKYRYSHSPEEKYPYSYFPNLEQYKQAKAAGDEKKAQQMEKAAKRNKAEFERIQKKIDEKNKRLQAQGWNLWEFLYNFDYLELPMLEPFWAPPEVVYPVLWILDKGGNPREATPEESLLCDYAILCYTHDRNVSEGEQRIYSCGTYTGKYFACDKFYFGYLREWPSERLQRAFNNVEPYLNEWLEQQRQPGGTSGGAAGEPPGKGGQGKGTKKWTGEMTDHLTGFDRIRDRAGRLIKAEFEKRQRVLLDNINRILRQKQLAHMAYTTGANEAVRAACDEEINEKATIVWNNVRRAYEACGAPITETLATDLKVEVRRHIETAVEDARKLVAKRQPALMQPNSLLADLESIKRQVQERFDAEVDCYVDSIRCKPAEATSNGQGGSLTTKPLSKNAAQAAKQRTEPATNGFYVFRGHWNPEEQEDQVFVIEFDEDGSIAGSCRVKRPVGRLDEYKCNAEENKLFEYVAQDDLIPAFRAPAWDELIDENDLAQAAKEYGGPLATSLKELGNLISEADQVFRNGPLVEWNDVCFILSQELRTAKFKCTPKDLPFAQHSWHLKQSIETCPLVLRILYSARRLKEPLRVACGSPEAARKFYGEIEETLRFIKKPREAKDYTATSGDYGPVGTLISWQEITGDLVYVGDSVTDGVRQADDLMTRLYQWQDKSIGRGLDETIQSGTGENKHQATTLQQFFEDYCDLSQKPDIESRREMLLREHRGGRITLPLVGRKKNYRRGQTYLFYLDRLLDNWESYRRVLTTLPPLKKSGNK